MKKIILLLNVVFIVTSGFSQKVAPNTYVINFKDKNNTEYSIDKPEEFLSDRAIKRRQKYNIPVTEQDIPVNKNYLKQVKDIGLEIYAISKWFNLVVVHTEDSALIEKVHQFEFVTVHKEEKNHKRKSKVKKPKKIEIESAADKDYAFDYGTGLKQIKMLNAHNLHNRGYTGQGIHIALLDAGFYNVDSLAGFDSIRVNNQILGTKDFVERDGDIYKDASHGMQVLSTIAANLPGKLVGTAPKAKYWLLRSEDDRSEYLVEEYYWLSAAEFADSVGADMIHSSLGYNDFDDKSMNHVYDDMNGDIAPATIAADIASSKGILVVTSAGNEGNDSWKYITSPADADSVLTVGSTTSSGKLSNFSSLGPTSDGRIKPDVMAQGSFAWVLGRKEGVTFSFGTSISAPIISGAVACLWQANPEFNNMEIIEAIQKTSDRYHFPKDDYGYGIPDFEKADKYLKMRAKQKYN